MKIIPFLLLLLKISAPLQAQTWQWNKSVYAATGQASLLRLCKDKYHNIYSHSVNGSVLEKFASNGVMIWRKIFPTNLSIDRIACGQDSAFYLIGSFTGSLSIGNSTIQSLGQQDICIAHFSPSGNLIWLRSMGCKDEDYGGDIYVSNNKIYITATTSDSIHFSSFVLPKDNRLEGFVASYHLNGTFDKATLIHPLFNIGSLHNTRSYEIELDKQGNPHFMYRQYTTWGLPALIPYLS